VDHPVAAQAAAVWAEAQAALVMTIRTVMTRAEAPVVAAVHLAVPVEEWGAVAPLAPAEAVAWAAAVPPVDQVAEWAAPVAEAHPAAPQAAWAALRVDHPVAAQAAAEVRAGAVAHPVEEDPPVDRVAALVARPAVAPVAVLPAVPVEEWGAVAPLVEAPAVPAAEAVRPAVALVAEAPRVDLPAAVDHRVDRVEAARATPKSSYLERLRHSINNDRTIRVLSSYIDQRCSLALIFFVLTAQAFYG